jgi:hypothetical protein
MHHLLLCRWPDHHVLLFGAAARSLCRPFSTCSPCPRPSQSGSKTVPVVSRQATKDSTDNLRSMLRLAACWTWLLSLFS